MFIFITNQELCVRELMIRVMGYDYSLDQNNIFKFVYYFMIIFLIYL
jgi:hypothetical protein